MSPAAPPPPPPPPPLKGVVIITLPPPEDPSQAKTITAFALTPPSETLSSYAASPPPASRSLPRFGSSRRLRRAAVWLLVAAAAAAALAWACASSERSLDLLRAVGMDVEGREDKKSRERESFVFQLYRKRGEERRVLRGEERRVLRAEGVAEIGGSSGKGRKDVVARLASRGSNESSVAFPVQGNVFPNGWVISGGTMLVSGGVMGQHSLISCKICTNAAVCLLLNLLRVNPFI